MQRREFLLKSCTVSGGALLGVSVPWQLAHGETHADESLSWSVAAWLTIRADGSALVEVHKSEMGQGVLTGLPMLIAEELVIPLERIEARLAPAAQQFRDARGNQSTGYSSSISSTYLPFLKLGAAAREILRRAAADEWQVPLERVQALSGEVVDTGVPGRRAHYGEFVQRARQIASPDDPPLISKRQRRVLGSSPMRRDTPSKVDGSAVFVGDIRLAGMQVAVVERCPHFGGRLRRVDASAALTVSGVSAIREISTGVAVVARDFWTASRARKSLRCEWDSGPHGQSTSKEKEAALWAALATRGRIAVERGNFREEPPSQSSRRVEADYFLPFLAHEAMEPLSTIAWVRPDRCELWVGTQAPSRAQDTAARLTGLPISAVHVHTQFIGGAFGRRGEWDYVAEAVELAKLFDSPVKVMWSREDDMRHDFYRPSVANRLSASLDERGSVVSWEHRLAGPSIARRRSPDILARGHDFLLTQGADDLLYEIPSLRVDYHDVDIGVPVGFWRSVGHSHTGFVVESFLDEVAIAGKRDPLELRLELLQSDPRMRAVLEKAAATAGWGQRRARGHGLGIACMKSYGTRVAEVAEVKVVGERLVVERVVCVVDCGVVVHPGLVRQQMEGAIIFGLSAALYGGVSFSAGAVNESNFNDQPVLRIAATPKIEVHILPSEAAPSGCGEPATPVIAPAVVNAIRAATGRSIRRLPLSETFEV